MPKNESSSEDVQTAERANQFEVLKLNAVYNIFYRNRNITSSTFFKICLERMVKSSNLQRRLSTNNATMGR